jgi:hypothetical protein
MSSGNDGFCLDKKCIQEILGKVKMPFIAGA